MYATLFNSHIILTIQTPMLILWVWKLMLREAKQLDKNPTASHVQGNTIIQLFPGVA